MKAGLNTSINNEWDQNMKPLSGGTSRRLRSKERTSPLSLATAAYTPLTVIKQKLRLSNVILPK
jgi:hypothetical protein